MADAHATTPAATPAKKEDGLTLKVAKAVKRHEWLRTVLIILVVLIAAPSLYRAINGSGMNYQRPVVGAIAPASVAIQAPAQVAVAPPIADEPAVATDVPVVAQNQCDDGWQFNGSVCVREARPTKTQIAQSFTAATCKPGDTRVIDRKVVENGREITRKVTQTCGVKS